MVDSHFEILGVPTTATEAEIRDAYRVLARRFHPDQHPGAPERERRQWEQAMAAINASYAVLSDPGARERHRRDLQAEQARRRVRLPHPDECCLCGAGPATGITFRYQTGWVLGHTTHGFDGTLCRACGLALGRRSQNRTLWTGWWSIRALVTNIGVLWKNALGLRSAARLAAPRRDPDVHAPLPFGLDPGRPVIFRGGVWFVAFVLVCLAGAIASSEEPTTSTTFRSESPDASSTVAAETWQVGSCIDGTAIVMPISCARPHTGRIIATTAQPSQCPYATDSYVDRGVIYCIDIDQ